MNAPPTSTPYSPPASRSPFQTRPNARAPAGERATYASRTSALIHVSGRAQPSITPSTRGTVVTQNFPEFTVAQAASRRGTRERQHRRAGSGSSHTSGLPAMSPSGKSGAVRGQHQLRREPPFSRPPALLLELLPRRPSSVAHVPAFSNAATASFQRPIRHRISPWFARAGSQSGLCTGCRRYRNRALVILLERSPRERFQNPLIRSADASSIRTSSALGKRRRGGVQRVDRVCVRGRASWFPDAFVPGDQAPRLFLRRSALRVRRFELQGRRGRAMASGSGSLGSTAGKLSSPELPLA